MSASVLRTLVRRSRNGTTTVEVAFVLPVFLTLVLGVVQICHAQMVEYVLKSACRSAARYGSAGSISTTQATNKLKQVLGCAINPTKATIQVKNAGGFEGGTNLPDTNAEFAALPDIELSSAEPRQMFLVRATVKYNDVAILSLPYCNGLTISGESLMRHE